MEESVPSAAEQRLADRYENQVSVKQFIYKQQRRLVNDSEQTIAVGRGLSL